MLLKVKASDQYHSTYVGTPLIQEYHSLFTDKYIRNKYLFHFLPKWQQIRIVRVCIATWMYMCVCVCACVWAWPCNLCSSWRIFLYLPKIAHVKPFLHLWHAWEENRKLKRALCDTLLFFKLGLPDVCLEEDKVNHNPRRFHSESPRLCFYFHSTSREAHPISTQFSHVPRACVIGR